MKSKDQILKIRAAVLYILNAFPDGLDYIKIFKILYFAQRQHLVLYGRTIIDDTFQARQKGPVSGFVRKGLKLIENSEELSDDFKLFGTGINVRKGNQCQIITSSESADTDELSISEIKCLDKYINDFKSMKSEDVSRISHDDKAWQKAFDRSKIDPQLRFMTILEIAEAGGASPSTLAYIKENLEIDQALN